MTLYIILGILVVLLGYLFTVQYIRGNKLERMADTLLENMQSISDLIQSSNLLMSNEQLVTAFSGDDEVGVFFRNLKEIQETLNQFVIPTATTATEESGEVK